MRLLIKRLGLGHVTGAESAGILGGKALAKLGLGTINPFMIMAVLQNTPVAHLFVLQHQSNWIIRGSKRMQMIAIWAFVYGSYHHLHYAEPLLRGSRDWKLPAGNWDTDFDLEGRLFFWNIFSCFSGLHGQPSKTKYLDEDGTVFMRAIKLAAKEIYPLAPIPPDFEICADICNQCPPWLFPQTQQECVLHGCHRFRESAVSRLDAASRRSMCPMPGDIRNGASYQIAFKMRQVIEPPLFVSWANGHASRMTERAFDQIEVLGPLDHQKFLLEDNDWQDHLPNYPLCLDGRTAARPHEPFRKAYPYVLGPLGAIWQQHTIDNWVEFQAKKGSSATATPGARPQMYVDEQLRHEYFLRTPDRSCHPGRPMTSRPADPEWRRGAGITATSSSRAASSTRRGAQASASSLARRGHQRPDSQSGASEHSWNQGRQWRR